MNWKSGKFDWNKARAFLVVAEEGSLSAAASALATSQPTLGRQIRALEAELNIALFERAGRGLELTPNGLRLLEYVRAMAEAANQLSLTASGQSESLEGRVTISATEISSALILPPIIKKLHNTHPGLTIEIIATKRESDLRRREADIALRNNPPKQLDLIAKKLPDIQASLYATTAYLESLGCPKTPADLKSATFLGVSSNESYIKDLKKIGIETGNENFPILTQNHFVHWALTKQGVGIGVMPSLIGDAEPLVQRVFKSTPLLSIRTWLVSHRELQTSRRIRVVFDFLETHLIRIGKTNSLFPTT